MTRTSECARGRVLAASAIASFALTGTNNVLAAEERTGLIEEIVVTAQKRIERLQDVPASVTAVNAGQLTAQGVTRFEDYANLVPGLSLTSSRTGATQVTLRGITTGPAQAASTTSFYIDEAPIGSVNAYTAGSSLTPDLDPSDLARIEVLKGPQGTLYGAGAVGGLVKFVTAEPDFTEFNGRISASVSDYKDGDSGRSIRGLVNVPIVKDTLVLRASGFDRVDPGYIDNVAGEEDTNEARVSGGRVALIANFNDSVRVELSALGQETRADGTNVVDVNLTTLDPLYGDLSQRRFTAEPSEVRLRVYNLKATANFGALGLLSSTTYQTVKMKNVADGSNGFGLTLGALFGIPNLGLRTFQETETERWSQEFRGDIAVLNDRLDLQVGLYFTDEDDSNRVPGFEPFSKTTGAILPLPTIINAAILSSYTEYSAFTNATYHFTDRFDVLAGVRYAYSEQDYFQDYSGLIVGPRRVNAGDEQDEIGTYMLSPRFKFSEDQMVYARFATGYRPGGPNAVPPPSVVIAPDTFKPDTLTSAELGYKASLLDHVLTIDAAVFYTDWRDIQIQTSAAGFNYFVNGGTAVSKGGEMTVRWVPTSGLTLGLNSAYTDARLSSAAPAAGGVDGDRLPFVPRWSGSVTVDYRWPVANDWDVVLGGSANYTGERISNYTNRAARTVPSFTTLNVRAGVERSSWSLSAYAKNLTDERGILSLGSQGLTIGPANPYSAGIIQPLSIGAELAYRF